MPIYEYRCEDCKRRVSVLVRRIGAEADECPRCGGKKLQRLWSRFALARSEEDRLERLASDAELSGLDENDPKSLVRLMKRMGQEMGEDAGPEFEQAMEEIERGGLEGGSPEGGERLEGEGPEGEGALGEGKAAWGEDAAFGPDGAPGQAADALD